MLFRRRRAADWSRGNCRGHSSRGSVCRLGKICERVLLEELVRDVSQFGDLVVQRTLRTGATPIRAERTTEVFFESLEEPDDVLQ